MPDDLLQLYQATRDQSLALCEPLPIEDYGLQGAAFASPPKWHLAHTSWFFETFILKHFAQDYATPDPRYEVLFNSYYNGVGEQHPRDQRGLLSRPTVEQVVQYRRQVDTAMQRLLAEESHPDTAVIRDRTVLGVEHERQHQELFFTDLKYSLSLNPLAPAYAEANCPEARAPVASQWLPFEGGLSMTGFTGPGFCFDNEQPQHKTFIAPFALAGQLVTNGDFQKFIDDDGYRRPELWLADGWAILLEQQWQSPLYWREIDGQQLEFTLHGLWPRRDTTPVSHISGYEADAYARWAGARLPTEQEWEHAAAAAIVGDVGMDCGIYHPRGRRGDEQMAQLYGECWQWTRSAYSPYPGFSPSSGAIGEYNGKFMSNQWVLRGGSCVSKAGQLRASYRNFFYPQDRWQFSGIRLARDVHSTG